MIINWDLNKHGKNYRMRNLKHTRALKAFATIMKEWPEIYSFSCTGNSHNKKNETACRLICREYQCDCLYSTNFEENLILACALIVYAKIKDLGTCKDRYGMWDIRKIVYEKEINYH